MLFRFKNDIKLGGKASTLEGRNKIQTHLAMLEEWDENNSMKLTEVKCKILHLKSKSQMHRYGIGWKIFSLVTVFLEKILEQ